MNRRHLLSGLVAAALAVATIASVPYWSSPTRTGDAGMRPDDHSAEPGENEAFERGPHDGRLLREGPFAVEVVLYEAGMPPEFRLYGFESNEPLPPVAFDAEVTLSRLGGEQGRFTFVPEADYRRGTGVVSEPHSFDVEVRVTYRGRSFRWAYESHEGRTVIPARVAEAQGIEVRAAGPATIREVVELTGTVQIDPGRISEVRARFPGVVTRVHRTIGDRVAGGETLALLETNESLRSVSIDAPIAGLIIDRNVQTGQPTGDSPLFVIADLSEVWINLDVFGSDLDTIAAGQPVRIETLGGRQIPGSVDWVSPLVAHGSQSVRARVIAANPDARLRPGQFVRATVEAARHEVPLAVERSALQRFRDLDVVFARVGDTYEVRMLELGQMDAERAEVLSGLRAGEIYVTENSYLIKADIEKSGASHDH